jgi:hypothetical protein
MLSLRTYPQGTSGDHYKLRDQLSKYLIITNRQERITFPKTKASLKGRDDKSKNKPSRPCQRQISDTVSSYFGVAKPWYEHLE